MNKEFVFQLSYDVIDSWYEIVGPIVEGLLYSIEDEVVVLDCNINTEIRKIIGIESSKKPNLILFHFREGELLQKLKIDANEILNEDEFSGDLFKNNGILRLVI